MNSPIEEQCYFLGCKMAQWPPAPSNQHSLALIWSVAEDVCIRTSSTSRRIGLLGTILQNGADRNVFLGANLWSRLRTLNHIQVALNYLGWDRALSIAQLSKRIQSTLVARLQFPRPSCRRRSCQKRSRRVKASRCSSVQQGQLAAVDHVFLASLDICLGRNRGHDRGLNQSCQALSLVGCR